MCLRPRPPGPRPSSSRLSRLGHAGENRFSSARQNRSGKKAAPCRARSAQSLCESRLKSSLLSFAAFRARESDCCRLLTCLNPRLRACGARVHPKTSADSRVHGTTQADSARPARTKSRGCDGAELESHRFGCAPCSIAGSPPVQLSRRRVSNNCRNRDRRLRIIKRAGEGLACEELVFWPRSGADVNLKNRRASARLSARSGERLMIQRKKFVELH